MKVLALESTVFMMLILEMTNHAVSAFHVSRRGSPFPPIILSSSASDDILTKEEDVIDTIAVDSTVAEKRLALLSLAQGCRDQYGVFLNGWFFPKSKQDDLMNAVEDLENERIARDAALELLPGDWDLICTYRLRRPAAIAALEALDVSPLVSLGNRFLAVTQRIRCMEQASRIDRVDHVIQYQPPNQLGDLIGEDSVTSSSSWWNRININPLAISKSQIILVHKADVVEDDDNSAQPKIRLQLQSIVNNVAGTKGNLNPSGADVLGVNLPSLGALNNNEALYDSLGGAFVTTYVDAVLRISRSTFAGGGQLRIFQRRAVVAASPVAASVDEDPVEPPSDVDE